LKLQGTSWPVDSYSAGQEVPCFTGSWLSSLRFIGSYPVAV